MPSNLPSPEKQCICYYIVDDGTLIVGVYNRNSSGFTVENPIIYSSVGKTPSLEEYKRAADAQTRKVIAVVPRERMRYWYYVEE